MKLQICLFVGIVLAYFACSSEAPSSKGQTDDWEGKVGQASTELLLSTDTTLLLFKAENKLELWISGMRKAVYGLHLEVDLPIGQFTLGSVSKEDLTIDFPDAYYLAKTKAGNDLPARVIEIPARNFDVENALSELADHIATGNEIYIFPNDSRLTKEFNPCFACPHWVAEQYSFLSLILKKYTN